MIYLNTAKVVDIISLCSIINKNYTRRKDMKKQLLAVMLCVAVLLGGCGGNDTSQGSMEVENEQEKTTIITEMEEETQTLEAVQTSEQIFGNVKYQIPCAWVKNKRIQDENVTSYYPKHSSDGEVLVLMQVSCVEEEVLNGKITNTEYETWMSYIIEGMTESSETELLTSENKSVNNIYGKEITYKYKAEGENNDFLVRGFYYFTEGQINYVSIGTREDEEKDWNEEYEAVLTSIICENALEIVDDSEIDDFANAENIKICKEYLKKVEISELIMFCNTYIEEKQPKSVDSVYSILELAQGIADLEDVLTPVTDEFTNETTIYYGDLQDISSSVHLVPYFSKHEMYFRVGFINSDWIFFDNAILKYGDDSNDTHDFSNDEKREVLGNGNVLEYIDDRIYSDEEIEEIIENIDNEFKIRFYGENDKTLDYTLSQQEKDAIELIYRYYRVYSIFDEL